MGLVLGGARRHGVQPNEPQRERKLTLLTSGISEVVSREEAGRGDYLFETGVRHPQTTAEVPPASPDK